MEYKSTVTILPEGIDKYAAFGEIVRNCDVFDILDDKDRYLEAVIKREKLQSTGIGHSTANRILALRRVRAFTRVEDLLQVRGICESKLNKLRPYVTVE